MISVYVCVCLTVFPAVRKGNYVRENGRIRPVTVTWSIRSVTSRLNSRCQSNQDEEKMLQLRSVVPVRTVSDNTWRETCSSCCRLMSQRLISIWMYASSLFEREMPLRSKEEKKMKKYKVEKKKRRRGRAQCRVKAVTPQSVLHIPSRLVTTSQGTYSIALLFDFLLHNSPHSLFCSKGLNWFRWRHLLFSSLLFSSLLFSLE